MIANKHQYEVTRQQLEKFERAISDKRDELSISTDATAKEWIAVQLDALQSQRDTLKEEIEIYLNQGQANTKGNRMIIICLTFSIGFSLVNMVNGVMEGNIPVTTISAAIAGISAALLVIQMDKRSSK